MVLADVVATEGPCSVRDEVSQVQALINLALLFILECGCLGNCRVGCLGVHVAWQPHWKPLQWGVGRAGRPGVETGKVPYPFPACKASVDSAAATPPPICFASRLPCQSKLWPASPQYQAVAPFPGLLARVLSPARLQAPEKQGHVTQGLQPLGTTSHATKALGRHWPRSPIKCD